MSQFQLIKRILPDLEKEYREDVLSLWRTAFGEEEVINTRDQLSGKECRWNDDILYLAVSDEQVAACCHLTRRKGTPWGGLGGVVSSPAFRRCGAGKAVCHFALQDFDAEGGCAVWLGTSNPAAADLYRELGFSFVAGCNIMLRITGKTHSAQLYEELFPTGESFVLHGSPAARIPIIPLCTQISDGILKEANAGICNPNIITQTSCMGLFPRFQHIAEAGGGWLMLETPVSIGGIGSWLPLLDGRIRADAFCHDRYASSLPGLMQTVLKRASSIGKTVFVPCSEPDVEKQNMLLSLGLSPGETEIVDLRNGLQIPVRNYHFFE